VLTIGMGALLIVLGYVLGLYFFDSPTAGLVIAILLWAIMSLVAYFQGDSILLQMHGAKKIRPDDHPRLYNVVEEMKIASGLEAMPAVYVIDDPSLNAFAIGRDPRRASVAITSGLLRKLNRDELQGVIAHEISHVKNRDVLLMAMCSILLGTIVLIAWYGSRFLLFGGAGGRRSSSRGGGQGQIIILIVALVFMILAPIMAQLIYFAISRKREYLADASAALYTRYPEGLAAALEKLGSSTIQLKSANRATAPMYIVNPFRKKGLKASDLSSTHPPLSERIRILRAMGGASFGEYDSAYRQVHQGGEGVIPAGAMAAAAVPLTTRKLEGEAAEPDEVQRARETSDAMWKVSNYRTISCDCGTKVRVPPNFREPQIQCPHCGKPHQL